MTEKLSDLVRRYADGRRICNCGQAYLSPCGEGIDSRGNRLHDMLACKNGCDANQLSCRKEIERRAADEIADLERQLEEALNPSTKDGDPIVTEFARSDDPGFFICNDPPDSRKERFVFLSDYRVLEKALAEARLELAKVRIEKESVLEDLIAERLDAERRKG